MGNCILLSHIHVYGNELYKHSILSFALDHCRKNNPNDFIILTGHGVRPDEDILNKADHTIWKDEIDEMEIGRGHPKIVDLGVSYAIERGFKYIVKCRADSIIVIPDIVEHCIDILKIEDKEILVSLGTEKVKYGLGDLFVCCKPSLLKQAWRPDRWDYNKNGLQNFGIGFLENLHYTYPAFEEWMKFLRSEVSYRDPINLGWVDLLGPHPHDGSKWKYFLQNHTIESLINNEFNSELYVWGKDWNHIPDTYLDEDFFYNG